MAVEIQGVSFNRILTFPFQNAASRRRLLALAGIWLAGFIIPLIPGFFVSGYMIRILRQAVREGKVEMPEWKEWDRILLDGLMAAAIGVLYLLPAIIVLIVGMIAYFVSFTATIPSSQYANSADPAVVLAPMLIMFLTMGLGMLLLLAGGIPLPVALARFADEGKFSAAFSFGEIFRALAANPVGFLGAWIVAMGIYYVATFAYGVLYFTIVLCCVGILFLILGMTLAYLIFIPMVGLAYREAKAGMKPTSA